MIQLVTQQTLIRYVYDELPPDAHQELEQALRHDPALADDCAELLHLQRGLNAMLEAPSAASTNAILAAARWR